MDTRKPDAISLSVKSTPLGKPSQYPSHLAKDWKAVKWTAQQVISHVTSGKPICVSHLTDGYRKAANFVQSSIVAIDVDSGHGGKPFTEPEYNEFLNSPFILAYAFAVIQSGSSVPGAIKCRVLFALDETVKDAESYGAIIRWVMSKMPVPPDEACKDVARFFYGGLPSRPADFVRHSNCLKVVDIVADIVNEKSAAAATKPTTSAATATKRKSTATSTHEALPDSLINQIVAKLGFRNILSLGSMAGWSEAIPCPHARHENDMTKPAGHWNPAFKAFKCFKCGRTYNALETAKALGIALPTVAASPTVKPTSKKKMELSERVRGFDLASFDADLEVSMPYISDLDTAQLGFNTWLIKSPIGTGKTELLSKLVSQANRVLIIVHRQALARSLAMRLGISCYSDLEDHEIASASKLVICINSLHKVAANDGTIRKFDLLGLDELTQQHEHVGSETFQGNEALLAYKLLKQVVADANTVVGLDAGMINVARDWMKAIRGECFCVVNNLQRQRGKMHIYAKVNRVIAAAMEAAERGNIAIAASYEMSARLDRIFSQRFGVENVVTVNRDNSLSQSVQNYLMHINEQPLPRVLIYTSSMGTGFDITQPVSAVFGIFQGDWFTAPDAMQMLGRCRNTQETHVYIQPNQDGARDESAKALYQQRIDAALKTGLEGDFDATGIFAVSDAQKSLLKMLTMYEAESNRSKNNLLDHFIELAQVGGFEISYKEGNDENAATEIEAASEAIAAERKILTMSSPPIDEYEMNSIRESGQDITPEIRAGYERWQIEDTVGHSIIETIYDALHKPIKRAALRLYANLKTDASILKELDRREAANEVLLHRRTHFNMRTKLITELIQEVWGVSVDDLVMAAEVTSDQITAGVKNWLRRNKKEIGIYFNRRKALSDAPMAIFRWILSRAGIEVDARRKREGETRFYVYAINQMSLSFWNVLAEWRLAALAAKRTEFEQRILSQNVHKDIPPAGNGTNETPKQVGFDGDDWKQTPLSQRLAYF